MKEVIYGVLLTCAMLIMVAIGVRQMSPALIMFALGLTFLWDALM